MIGCASRYFSGSGKTRSQAKWLGKTRVKLFLGANKDTDLLTDNKSEFENDKGTQIVNEWVAMTAEAAIGAPGGALLGFFVGGAPGVAVGASVGSLISHTLK